MSVIQIHGGPLGDLGHFFNDSGEPAPGQIRNGFLTRASAQCTVTDTPAGGRADPGGR
jgi:hypothetical protein